MSRRSSRRPRWRGLRLVVFSALAFAAAICTILFIIDVASGVDIKQSKAGIKSSVKRGHTAFAGMHDTTSQGESLLGGVFAVVILFVSGVTIQPIVRSRTIPQRSKLKLGGSGIVLGLAMVIPMNISLIALVRLIS